MLVIKIDQKNDIPKEIQDFTRKRILNHIKMVGWNLDLFIDDKNYTDVKKYLLYEKDHHDESKLSKEEFKGYCIMQACKYGISVLPNKYESANKETNDVMDEAWDHHQKCNAHHPQYWTLKNQVMPTWAKISMICDHASVSIENNSNLLEWEVKSLKNPKKEFKYDFTDNDKKELLNYVKIIEPNLNEFQKRYLSIKILKV